MTIQVNDNIQPTQEGQQILKECVHFMKGAVEILGNALDHDMLDEEGSKLLDWAMIDQLSMLYYCERCLLCRQKESLRNSHIWPKFIAKSLSEKQVFIFGHDKHKLKSPGKCTY